MTEKEVASQIRDMGGSTYEMVVRTGEENTGQYWTKRGSQRRINPSMSQDDTIPRLDFDVRNLQRV